MGGNRKTNPSKFYICPCQFQLLLTYESEEHQRRSPECTFFTLTQPASVKPVRGKIGRPSKASRLSIQSQVTATNEGHSMIDIVADEGDSTATTATNMTIASTLPRVGKKGEKAKKAKSQAKPKNIKLLAEEPLQGSSFVEPEDDDFEVKVEQSKPSKKRGKKRASDEMDDVDENVEDAKPPAVKQRATRTRGSTLGLEPALDPDRMTEDIHMTDAEGMPPPELPKSKKGANKGRKRASSTTRKVSTMSAASKASLRGLPADEEIDASLEADLNRPLTDEAGEAEERGHTETKSRRLTRTRPGSKKVTASAAHLRGPARAAAMPAQEVHVEVKINVLEPSTQDVGQEATREAEPGESITTVEEHTIKQKTRGGKFKGVKKLSTSIRPQEEGQNDCIENVVDHHTSQLLLLTSKNGEVGEAIELELENLMVKKNSPAQKIPKKSKNRQPSRQISGIGKEASGLSSPQPSADQNVEFESSMLTTRTAEDDSGHETDASTTSRAPVKRGGRKAGVLKKGRKPKKVIDLSQNIEDIVQAAPQAAIETHLESSIINILEPQQEQPTATSLDNYHSGGVGPVKAPIELSTEEKGVAKDTKPKVGKGRPKRKAPSSVSVAQEDAARPIALSPLVDQHNPSAVPIEPFLSSRRNSVTFTPKVLPPTPKHAVPSPTPSPQSSDAENQPPSSRPSQQRPPLFETLQSNWQTVHVPLAVGTPNTSPSRRNIASRVQTTCAWTNVDLETIFLGSPKSGNENAAISVDAIKDGLTSPEKRMTVEEWIKHNAQQGEERLRNECERLVGRFEGEGNRALRALEGIICEE